MTIDVMSGEPAYVQLARILRTGIADGTYPPRTPVPSARRLSQEHGVAMGTANRALAVLKAEGLVVTVPGRGMYVTERG